MKSFHKKIIGLLLMTLLTFFGLSFGTNKVKAEETEAKAYIAFAANDWGVQYWGEDDNETVVATNQTVSALGEYTVKIDVSEAADIESLEFMALMISNGETLFPNNYMNITSVKVDGEEIELETDTYTSSDDEVETRTNLYNVWVSKVTEGRTPYGSLAGVSPTPLNPEDIYGMDTLEITFTLEDGVDETPIAYLQFADKSWGDGQFWLDGSEYEGVAAVTVPVTELNESYTVSLDFTAIEGGGAGEVEFFDVEILNGEIVFPGSFMEIDEVKINGEVVELATATYTSTDNDVHTRTNLYNNWVGGPIVQGRTKDGSLEGISAKPVTFEGITKVETIEVTFTLVEGVKLGATPLPEEGTKAYIVLADSTWEVQYWAIDGEDNHEDIIMDMPEITGYGQYTVKIDLTEVGVIDGLEFFGFEILGGEMYFPANYTHVDEIKINGDIVELAGKAYTSSENGVDTRVNLINNWVTAIESGRVDEGLTLEDVSAKPLDIEGITEILTVEITFTIHERALEVEEEYELPENPEFNAFMMFQDISEAWSIFEPGIDGNTTVTGDGTYTVYLKGVDIEATGKATEAQVFLIDIEELGKAMVHLGTLREDSQEKLVDTDLVVTVKIWVDDVEVEVNHSRIKVGDLEGNGRLRIEFYNEWGSTADLPAVDVTKINPENEIKIEFTLTGTGIEGEAPVNPDPTDPDPTDPDPTEPEPTDPETDDEESSSLTWLWITLGAIVVLGAGAGVFVVLKRRP